MIIIFQPEINLKPANVVTRIGTDQLQDLAKSHHSQTVQSIKISHSKKT